MCRWCAQEKPCPPPLLSLLLPQLPSKTSSWENQMTKHGSRARGAGWDALACSRGRCLQRQRPPRLTFEYLSTCSGAPLWSGPAQSCTCKWLPATLLAKARAEDRWPGEHKFIPFQSPQTPQESAQEAEVRKRKLTSFQPKTNLLGFVAWVILPLTLVTK